MSKSENNRNGNVKRHKASERTEDGTVRKKWRLVKERKIGEINYKKT